MKNKIAILFIIFLQVFLTKTLFSQEVEFNASNIEILSEKELTIANDAEALIKTDGIKVEGSVIKYFKNKSLLTVEKGKIFKIDNNLEIDANQIKYELNDSKLILDNKINIRDKQNNIIINSNKIIYEIKDEKILGLDESQILDNFGNIYTVDEFEYSLKNKVIKLTNLKVFDKEKNLFELDLGFLDLNKKELLAKDVSLNFKISENSQNEPRLKGRSLVSNDQNTIVKKGTFTFCKKREKCPPWEMSADEIRHDKKNKTIHYKNAKLKIYDKHVFYFPKFFHPDPTVERQTGFLIPRLQDNSATGLSLNLPYFLAIAKDKDMTLNPRFFNDDKFLLQTEFRKKNKNSDYIIDLSQFISSDENSKGHLFYNFNKNYVNKNSDNVELNIQLEQVTNNTYLKTYKLESPIINDTSMLSSSISIAYNNNLQSLDTNIDVYEDLSKTDSDKYEYVPNFYFSKILNDNLIFNSEGYYKNYNTNITEKILINNFEYNSMPTYSKKGVINQKKFLIKNINSEAKNSKNYKNKSNFSLVPTLLTNYSFPLKKETKNFDKILTPRFSIRLSPSHTKDVRKKDRQINYNNIYDLNRLGISDTSEGGISATYGYEYKKIDKSSLNEQITLGFANNIRFEENKDLPSNSNLGDKVSDFVGLFEYKPDENLKFNYDFSLKNNLINKNYELFGFEFYLNNLTSKVEYLNENNSNSKTSYIQNETKYKFNENNSIIFETRENKEKSFTEFYNLIYQYQNDCLSAAIEYNKEYYIDKDLQPSENLFFKISILPFGGFNSPNLRWF